MPTPGVRVSRSSNLRPSTGVDSTVRSFSVELDSVFVESRTGDPVTVMVCCTVDIFSVSVREMAWPTVSVRFSWTSVAKPGCETVAEYFPGGNCGATKRPSGPVARLLWKFVSTFRIVTDAPGSTPPDSSLTTACIVPVVI